MTHQKKRASAAMPPPGPASVAPGPSPVRRSSRLRWLPVSAGLVIAAAGWLIANRLPRRPNLLLITIDTLRADHVGSYGYSPAQTPVLDGLARRGVRFENALAPAPITGPSHSTILTGLYPPVHGVRDNVIFPLNAKHPNAATLLKKQGYRTGGFVSAYPVAGSFGFNEGFDTFSEAFHESVNPGEGGAERPANETIDAALDWLKKENGSPFFAWVHLYDPHSPYKPPAPFDATFQGQPYDGEIAFADSQLGRVMDWLKTTGREADTIVALVADHGESLGEHGETTHAILIYQATLHVPFILAGPGAPENTVIGTPVSLVDLLPTLLGMLKLDPPGGLDGRDLGPLLRGQRLAPQGLYAESLFGRLNLRWSSLRALVEGDWKLIEGREPELFNIADDPSESKDLALLEPVRLNKMREALRVAVRSMAPQGDSAKANAISPEQEERLRSLGYTSGSAGSGSLDQKGLPDPRAFVRLYEQIQQASPAQGPAVDKALEQMVAITKIDSGNPYAQYALGNLAYRSGRLRLADEAYARALALDPDRPGMRLTYGRLLRDLSRFEDSEKQLRMAVEQTTADDIRTRVSLAETLIALKKTDEADALLKAALARSPGHLEALTATGKLLIAVGRGADSIPFLEKAAAGSDPDPWIELARAHLGLGNPRRAVEAGEGALRRNPGHPLALAVTGHALIIEGNKDAGLDALARALAARPKRPEAWLILGAAFDAAGDGRRAEMCRREAAAIVKVPMKVPMKG